MIQTSLTNLILINLCGLLVLLALLWAGRAVRELLRERRRRRHKVVCNLCGHVFTNATREIAVQCPACEHLVPRQELLNL
jgi:DNA-directed RNA polymerase subunit RPC12/RpoP